MEDLQIGVKGIVMVGLRVRHWSALGDRSGVTLLPAFMLDSLRVYQMENIRENKRDDKIISCRFTVCLGRDII